MALYINNSNKTTSLKMEAESTGAFEFARILVQHNDGHQETFDQDVLTHQFWNNLDGNDKTDIFREYINHHDITPNNPTFQDYVVKAYYATTHNIHLEINECIRLRYHNKITELNAHIIDAKDATKVTWHKQTRVNSKYNGRYYIKMQDVRIMPKDDDGNNPVAKNVVPIITRYEAKVPMGTCNECMRIGQLRMDCDECDGSFHTINFHNSRTAKTDKEKYIINPIAMAHLHHPNSQPTINILHDRSDTPLRWTEVSFENPDEYIDNLLINPRQGARIDRAAINEHAITMKISINKFHRMYERNITAFNAPDFTFINRINDDESVTSVDKNTIGEE